ncbi:hypothetical protein BH11MYX3_BH11MYX3_05650 [soil metagenome]
MTTRLLLALALTACAVDPPADDSKDDRFLIDGKTDNGAIGEGSSMARAVLRVVNELDGVQLYAAAGVQEEAERAIEVYRRGADHQRRTIDDRYFDSLAQLDALEWVGPQTFDKLLAFAQQRGYVDNPPSFVPTRCDPMSYEHLRALAEGGVSGPGTTGSRVRTSCDTTHCSEWHDGVPALQQTRTLVPVMLPSDGAATLATLPNGISFAFTNGSFATYCDPVAIGGRPTGSLVCVVTVNVGSTREYVDYDPTTQQTPVWSVDLHLRLAGTVCDDGRYHLISTLGYEMQTWGELKNVTNNWNQISIEGRFP